MDWADLGRRFANARGSNHHRRGPLDCCYISGPTAGAAPPASDPIVLYPHFGPSLRAPRRRLVLVGFACSLLCACPLPCSRRGPTNLPILTPSACDRLFRRSPLLRAQVNDHVVGHVQSGARVLSLCSLRPMSVRESVSGGDAAAPDKSLVTGKLFSQYWVIPFARPGSLTTSLLRCDHLSPLRTLGRNRATPGQLKR